MKSVVVGVILAATASSPVASAKLYPKRPGQMPIDEMIDRSADRNGVPRDIAHAIAYVESTKTCGLTNGPSKGLMQVNKGTAKEVGIPWPFRSCEQEIEAGMRYLRKVIDKGGETCNGMTLYNEGLYAGNHCSDYGRKVMRLRGKV